MSKGDQTLGDFHKPSNPGKHPANSIGNQQVWNEVKQVGAIEYIVNPLTQSVDVQINSSSGKNLG